MLTPEDFNTFKDLLTVWKRANNHTWKFGYTWKTSAIEILCGLLPSAEDCKPEYLRRVNAWLDFQEANSLFYSFGRTEVWQDLIVDPICSDLGSESPQCILFEAIDAMYPLKNESVSAKVEYELTQRAYEKLYVEFSATWAADSYATDPTVLTLDAITVPLKFLFWKNDMTAPYDENKAFVDGITATATVITDETYDDRFDQSIDDALSFWTSIKDQLMALNNEDIADGCSSPDYSTWA